MRVLILTSINPVLNVEIYRVLSSKYSKTNVEVLSFPFFAEMKKQVHGGAYIPIYFSMIQAAIADENLRKKLYAKQNTIVIGNVYKEEKFDYIISYNELGEETFDSFIDTVKTDPQFEEFRKKAYLEELYKPEDAEISLPTIEHIKLFLEGVFR
jgi:hypothetical protein